MYISENDNITYQVNPTSGQIQIVHPITKFGFVLELFNDVVSIVKHGEFHLLEDYVRESETLASRTAYLGFVQELHLIAYAFPDEMPLENQTTIVNYMIDHTRSTLTNRLYEALEHQQNYMEINNIFTEMIHLQNKGL